MEKEGYVYKDEYIVNYCTHCGTSLSELETVHIERKDPLYYLKYGPFVLATVRPETKFGDTAVAVHPKDKRYKKWIGKEIEVEGLLGRFRIKVIADEMVDMKFGTGVVKGFALALAIGILVSMFTAIVVTRTFLRFIYREKI